MNLYYYYYYYTMMIWLHLLEFSTLWPHLYVVFLLFSQILFPLRMENLLKLLYFPLAGEYCISIFLFLQCRWHLFWNIFNLEFRMKLTISQWPWAWRNLGHDYLIVYGNSCFSCHHLSKFLIFFNNRLAKFTIFTFVKQCGLKKIADNRCTDYRSLTINIYI